jgi:hypothetical protein
MRFWTGNDFHDAFRKWQKLWKRRIPTVGLYFEADGG